MQYKKIVIILVVVFLLILSSCQTTKKYVFIASSNDIIKIEIGTFGEENDYIGGDEQNLSSEASEQFTLIKEIDSEKYEEFLSDFKKLHCFTKYTDPSSMKDGTTCVKIIYSNNDFEIISENTQATYKNGTYKYSGYYYFDAKEFTEFLKKYSN